MLLSLLHPDLAQGPASPEANTAYRTRLAQHFVQRRRPDIEDQWGDARAFAKPRSLSLAFFFLRFLCL